MSGTVIERCRERLARSDSAAVFLGEPGAAVVRGYNAALRVVLDGIEATQRNHHAVEGQGYRDVGGYGDINPACATCGTFDEYAVPWPCGDHERATASLTAIARALGVPDGLA